MVLDASVGSGTRLGPGVNGTVSKRTPTYLGIDLGFIIARDTSVEWTMGAIVQIEDQPAAALHPQVRLVKQVKSTKVLALIGAPLFLVPTTMLGLDFGGGVVIPVNDAVGIFTVGTVGVFFEGEDIQKDSVVTAFNLGLGARISF